MKKIFTLLAILALILSAGCERTDFDEILRRQENQLVTLNDHEARIKALEDLVKTVNTDIENLKKITDALEKKVSIVSYKELEDGTGYELTMSNNTKIVLKHGAKGDKGDKGDKPLMGTKPFGPDNRLYWTIDGEWLLDADGNKVPATGDKGEKGDKGNKGDKGDPGVTPILRANTHGNWEMSTDGGKTWQLVTDTNGDPVKAVGKDGQDGIDGKDGQDGTTPDLKIEETADAIIITLNGKTYTLPKGAPLPGIDPAKLIGKWNWTKNEEPDGSGGWVKNSDDWSGYWVRFDDATNGADSNFPFTYTVTGNKLDVSEWWVGDYTIIVLDDNNLVLEWDGALREHYTRDSGSTPPTIDPAKLIGTWKQDDGHVILTYNSDGTGSDSESFNWTLTGNRLTYTNSSTGIPDMTIVSLTETQLVLDWGLGDITFTKQVETPPTIDPAKLIGKWNWAKNEEPDGSGVWVKNSDDWSGYWVRFDDATNGADNSPFTYTLTGNKLDVSIWGGDFTIIVLDDNNLVLERNGVLRQHYTRDSGSTPPPF